VLAPESIEQVGKSLRVLDHREVAAGIGKGGTHNLALHLWIATGRG
jgi:hypothetical protein